MEEISEVISSASEEKNSKPSYLCKQCGLCCCIVVPSYTPEELKQMAQDGEEEAMDFLSIFVPYESLDDIPEYGRPHYNQIINAISEESDTKPEDITVYYCKYLKEDKTCSIYEQRPDLCRRAPHNGWSLFAPTCGFAGWQFVQREKQKQSVRRLKEILYEIEMTGHANDTHNGMTIEELKEHIKEKIQPYEKYGAKNW